MKFNNSKELKVGDRIVFVKDDKNLELLYEKYGYSKYASNWPNKYNGSKIVEVLYNSCRKGVVIKRFRIGPSSEGEFATVFDFEIRRI